MLSRDFSMTEEFPFYISQFEHHSARPIEEHSHEFIELVFVVDGRAQHMFEGKLYPLHKNDVFIINPGETHTFKIKPNQPLKIINCLFTSSFIGDAMLKELGVSRSMDFLYVQPFLDEEQRFNHFINIEGKYASKFMSILENLMDEYEQKNNCYATLIRLQFIELLIILSRIYHERQPENKQGSENDNQLLVRQIIGYLTRNYDQKIKVSNLCELFNISSRHLSRIFKQFTDQTMIEKLHDIRMNRAKTLLLETDDKVLDIALQVGYNDPAFFSKVFQRITGYSPGQYKEKMTERFEQYNV